MPPGDVSPYGLDFRGIPDIPCEVFEALVGFYIAYKIAVWLRRRLPQLLSQPTYLDL